MACPMGFTMEDLERRIKNDQEREIADRKYPDVKPFDTIAQPNELRRFMKEAIYLTGGQYALLCLFLHPGLARGAVEHSDFDHHLMDRLRTTTRFINAVIFGTELEKRSVISVLHKEHKMVVGEGYSADDPELHKWSAATLYMSVKMVHEAFFHKLARNEEVRLYKEAAIYGTSLKMPADSWPATLDDFYAYWNGSIANLQMTDQARTLSRQLLYPKHIPVYLKPALPFARLLTAQWLPPRLQQEYRLQNNKIQRGVYKALTSYVHIMYPLIPKFIRHREHKKIMKDLKMAVQRIEDTGTWDEKGKSSSSSTDRVSVLEK